MARRRREHWPRTASLIALGAFGVHQLRYLAADGGDAGARLAAEGHGYFAGVVPLLGAFILAALASLIMRAAGGRTPAAAVGALRGRWAAYSLAVFCVFAAQESLEGIFASGHASGFAAVFGHGGWLALPAAALAGFVLAIFERRLLAIERRVAAITRALRRAAPRPPRRVLAAAALRLRPLAPSPLAFGLARRPPPELGAAPQ